MRKFLFMMVCIGLSKSELVADYIANISYRFDKQLCIDNRQIFEVLGKDHFDHFNVGDSVTVIDNNTGIYILKSKDDEEVSCRLFATVESEPHFVAKVMGDMVLLSNGEICVVNDRNSYDWALRAPVLLVITPEYWDRLIDLKTGVSQYVMLLGKVEWGKVVDEVIGHEGEYVVLKKSGKFKAFSDRLGYNFWWQVGDKIYVKKFIQSYVIGTTPPVELRFLYNATRGEVSVSLTGEE